MRVLDLYSGTGGWSQAFLDRGHFALRIDNDPQFATVPHTIIDDVCSPSTPDFLGAYEFDVILASPPCQAFSLASVRHHFLATNKCANCGTVIKRLSGERWSECCDHQQPKLKKPIMEPKSDFGRFSLELVKRTLDIVAYTQPKFWWMENPRATMQHFVPPTVPRTTVWYCQYGDLSAKPTHLWGQWPDTWTPRPECHNGNRDCHHQPAERGSKTGTQGKKGAVARAVVPYELSMDVCLAVEKALS